MQFKFKNMIINNILSKTILYIFPVSFDIYNLSSYSKINYSYRRWKKEVLELFLILIFFNLLVNIIFYIRKSHCNFILQYNLCKIQIK